MADSDAYLKDPKVSEYRQLIRRAEELRKELPAEVVLGMASNGFILAHDELHDVIQRLGQRREDLNDLISVAKSLNELSRKVARLSERLIPEFVGGSDVR